MRARQHAQYVAAREAAMWERVAESSGGDPEGRARVEALIQEAYDARPYPCLSIACPDW